MTVSTVHTNQSKHLEPHNLWAGWSFQAHEENNSWSNYWTSGFTTKLQNSLICEAVYLGLRQRKVGGKQRV